MVFIGLSVFIFGEYYLEQIEVKSDYFGLPRNYFNFKVTPNIPAKFFTQLMLFFFKLAIQITP